MMNQIEKTLLSLSILLFVACGDGGGSEVVVSSASELQEYTKGETFTILKGENLTVVTDGTTFDVQSDLATGENIITITNGSVNVE